MKTIKLVLLVVVAVVWGVAPTASARASSLPVRECKSSYSLRLPVRNLATRRVSCRDARKFVKRVGFVAYGRTTFRFSFHFYVYTCRTTPNPRSWWVDTRCTGPGGRVVHWQYESGE